MATKQAIDVAGE